MLADALAKNSVLTKLNLADNGIQEAGAKALLKALKINICLQTLDLKGNVGISRDSMARIDYDLGGNRARPDAARLLDNETSPKDLDLNKKDFGDKGAEVLADALAKNSVLTHLELADNGIGDEGAKALLKALEDNKTIQTLDLKGNVGISRDTMVLIERALGGNKTQSYAARLRANDASLVDLNLSAQSLTTDDVKNLAKAIEDNSILQTLNLSSGCSFLIPGALTRYMRNQHMIVCMHTIYSTQAHSQ